MYEIEYAHRMKKDLKRMRKRGKDTAKLATVLNLLASGNPLPPHYRDHQLTGNFHRYRECHIEPDWLLLYTIVDSRLVILATATGTHADLFGM